MTLYWFWAPCTLALCLVQCAHSVHQVHLSNFTPKSKARDGITIYAHSEETLVLGLKNKADLMDIAVEDLLKKCPEGHISGITTAYITDLGLLSWTNHIYLTGQCIPVSSSKPLYAKPALDDPLPRT